MNAPGKGILKVSSILFIIFGAIATIASIALLFLGGLVTSALDDYGAGSIGGIVMVASIIALVGSVLDLVLGIVGLTKCKDPSKAGYFIVVGIILCVLSLISLILGIANGSFSVISLIGFVLPILYIVGGSMNKKVAVTQ